MKIEIRHGEKYWEKIQKAVKDIDRICLPMPIVSGNDQATLSGAMSTLNDFSNEIDAAVAEAFEEEEK